MTWASGEHELRLQIVDQDGNIISTIPLPTYVLRPALQTPSIVLASEYTTYRDRR